MDEQNRGYMPYRATPPQATDASDILSGFQPGLYLVTGKAGAGKSLFGWTLYHALVEQGHHAAAAVAINESRGAPVSMPTFLDSLAGHLHDPFWNMVRQGAPRGKVQQTALPEIHGKKFYLVDSLTLLMWQAETYMVARPTVTAVMADAAAIARVTGEALDPTVTQTPGAAKSGGLIYQAQSFLRALDDAAVSAGTTLVATLNIKQYPIGQTRESNTDEDIVFDLLAGVVTGVIVPQLGPSRPFAWRWSTRTARKPKASALVFNLERVATKAFASMAQDPQGGLASFASAIPLVPDQSKNLPKGNAPLSSAGQLLTA